VVEVRAIVRRALPPPQLRAVAHLDVLNVAALHEAVTRGRVFLLPGQSVTQVAACHCLPREQVRTAI
jgi:hypothetical protein